MTRMIMLIDYSHISQIARLLAGQVGFVSLEVPRFDIPLSIIHLEGWMTAQKFSFAQNSVQSLQLSNTRKVELKRKFLPQGRMSSSQKRSCFTNSSGRRVGRRNGSR